MGPTKGAVLVTDNRVLNGPLGRSLRSFVRTAHSLRSAALRFAPLARSIHGLARGTVENHDYVFTL